MFRRIHSTLPLLLCLVAAHAAAEPARWHTAITDGLAAAEKSRRPLFVVTLWKRGV